MSMLTWQLQQKGYTCTYKAGHDFDPRQRAYWPLTFQVSFGNKKGDDVVSFADFMRRRHSIKW